MSYLIHFNPNHDPKNGQFTFSDRSKIKNYVNTIGSLSDKEYKLFTDSNGKYDKKAETEWAKDFVQYQKEHEDSFVFVSKYGNVTIANLEPTDEWNMGWATNPKKRGTGVTQSNIQEAISMVRKYSDLPISAIIEQENIPSQKTAEKAGFKDVGYVDWDDGSTRKKYTYE